MKHFFLAAFLCLSSMCAFAQTKPKKQIPATIAQPPVVLPTAPPEETIKPIKAEPGKDIVAIYPFTTSRDYTYDYALSVGNAVEAGFVRSGRFTVVERNRFGSVLDEDRFKEANTADIVKKAARFGAKTIVTGHVVGVSHGDVLDYNNRPSGNVYVEVSLSFKIIDVETGVIKMSEIIRGKGVEKNNTAAQQNAYITIDQMVRRYVNFYLPQRFKFMSVVATGTRKKQEYLDKFKIWGGSDNGLNVGDVIEIYSVNFLTNPDSKQQVEEKQLLAQANITEINSGSTATCTIIDGSKKGQPVLALSATPEKLVIEYKGNWYQKKSFLDALIGN